MGHTKKKKKKSFAPRTKIRFFDKKCLNIQTICTETAVQSELIVKFSSYIRVCINFNINSSFSTSVLGAYITNKDLTLLHSSSRKSLPDDE